MKITVDKIAKLKPCKERFDNFVKHYPKFSGDLADFVSLENITYSDKIWVAVRLLDKNTLVSWSIACADSVLHFYKIVYPGDSRVSNLLEYMKTISDFENMTESEKTLLLSHRKAAYAAATTADAADAAYYAAYAAATAAAAYAVAAHTTYYATYAAHVAAYAAHAAASAANAEEQRNLNLLLLVASETT